MPLLPSARARRIAAQIVVPRRKAAGKCLLDILEKRRNPIVIFARADACCDTCRIGGSSRETEIALVGGVSPGFMMSCVAIQQFRISASTSRSLMPFPCCISLQRPADIATRSRHLDGCRINLIGIPRLLVIDQSLVCTSSVGGKGREPLSHRHDRDPSMQGLGCAHTETPG
jgi:hypothetical protein